MPAFYSYHDAPVKLVEATDGGVTAWKLSRDSGGWLPANHLIRKLLFESSGEIERLTREEFIQLTEHCRGYYLRGDSALHALYETVRAIEENQARERRYPTEKEVSLVREIHRRTFVIFEEGLLAGGDPAADPSLGGADTRR
ncbi:hypothetical protein GA0070616_3638 [Micromonospora nigra]|uniref:Uncharacterized protein n=1 Tax=Micromonospora nigra TaxID=145857 RepID=A0A1C6SF66_9ACTN|nr:hypothetical protein GA0070616_3638 [Micromonospora nigra]